MNKTFALTTVAYVLVMLGCTFAFYVQQYVIFHDHIRPGRSTAGDAIAVEITEKGENPGEHASLVFLDSGPLTNPLRMGSEIEEQLQALLFANLATGVFLIVVYARKNAKRAVPN
jgi:hypothetical protein